jgi:hypothetical protein
MGHSADMRRHLLTAPPAPAQPFSTCLRDWLEGLAEVLPHIEALIEEAKPHPELMRAIRLVVQSGRDLLFHLDEEQAETAAGEELIRRFAELAARLDEAGLLMSF